MSTRAHTREPGRVEPPERSPAAIRAELPDELRAQFDADYLATLGEARSSFRLDRLDEVIQAWWLSGWARRPPAGNGDRPPHPRRRAHQQQPVCR